MITPSDEDTLSELPEVDSARILVADHGAATTVGLVRPANEDHYGSMENLFVVADGMGGAEGGALASQLTVDHLLASSPDDGWIAALAAVNSSVRDECFRAGYGAAGSTVVGVVVEESRCVTLAVGDSRIYRVREGELQQLTTDHNLGNLRREEGLDPTLGDDRGKPRALTSYIGNPDQAQRLDVGTVSARHGDRMLLTTDGVHEALSPAELLRLAMGSSCQESSDAIVAAANAAGGRDNATTMIIELASHDETGVSGDMLNNG